MATIMNKDMSKDMSKGMGKGMGTRPCSATVTMPVNGRWFILPRTITATIQARARRPGRQPTTLTA